MTAGTQRRSHNLVDEVRAQHFIVKFILLAVVMVVLSPAWAVLVSAGYQTAGVLGVLVAVGLSLWLVVWILFTKPADNVLPGDPGRRWRYCTGCGAASKSADNCPECGVAWPADDPPETPQSVASFLNYLTQTRHLVDSRTFAAVVRAYEARLHQLRAATLPASPSPGSTVPEETMTTSGGPPSITIAPPAPTTRAGIEPPAAPAARPPAPVSRAAFGTQRLAGSPSVTPTVRHAPHEVAAPVVPRPVRPPEPPGPTIGDMGRAVVGWAAERQADILLYVGAFLLSVAAIIFVAYRGGAVGDNTRFAILSAYALGFLVFGLGLHRWERVKEAGPVFVALGAILVPIDFVMLRTQVLTEDQLATDTLVFWASATCALLYFTLAARGYGRWYAFPGVPAALLAWGALGSMFNLPIEWFGAWFQIVATPAYVVATRSLRDWRIAPLVLGAAVVVGVGSLVVAHATAWDGDRAALPAAYLPATAAVAAGLRFQRSLVALAALPAMVGVTAGSAWWAAFGLGVEWSPLFAIVAGAGYLVVAHFDEQKRSPAWGAVAGLLAACSLVAVQGAVLEEGSNHAALPATGGAVFALSAAGFARWRWAVAGAALPPLGAATVLSALWAGPGVGLEWYGLFGAAAALGYLMLAHFDRPERTVGWQRAATALAILGLVSAHATVAADSGADGRALPATYALSSVGAVAAFVRWRWSWRVAPGALPVLVPTTALTTAWAEWQLQPEWFGAFAAATALGHLLLAHFDRPELARWWAGAALAGGLIAIGIPHTVLAGEWEADSASLPAAYGMLFVGASGAYGRWRWAEAGALLPPLGTMTVATAWWSVNGLVAEWYGVFAAAAALGYLALAYFDRSERARAWAGSALVAGAAAIAIPHAVLANDSDAATAALPISYGMAFFGIAVAFARWRWAEAGALLPPVGAMTAGTAWWSANGLGVEWYGVFAAAAALGYLALAYFDRSERARAWAGSALVTGAGAIAIPHAVLANDTDIATAAVPITYGMTFFGLAVAFARWRWTEPGALLPPVGAMTAATAWWSMNGLDPEWYGVFAALATVGYLALGFFDRVERVQYWRLGIVLTGVLAIALAHATVGTDDDARQIALPLTYAPVLATAAAAFARWRYEWRVAPGVLPGLAAMTTLTAAWAQWDVQPEWYAAFIAPAAAGYVASAALDRGAWPRNWIGMGMAVGTVALGLAHATQFAGEAERESLPLVYAELLVVAGVAAAVFRLKYREVVAVLPALGAGLGASLSWAVFDMRLEWLGAWTAASAVGYLLPAMLDTERARDWRVAALLISAGSLAIAHPVCLEQDPVRWQLPMTYAVLLAGWCVDAARERTMAWLPPLLASMLAGSWMWAAGIGPEWWPLPALAIAAGVMATARWWEGERSLATFGWTYAVLLGVLPTLIFLPVHYTHPEHGVAAQGITAVLLVWAAFAAGGTIGRLVGAPAAEDGRKFEWGLLLEAAFAFAFGAAASLNGVLELSSGERAWTFAAVAMAGWLLAALPLRRPEGFWTFVPAGLAGMTLSAVVAAPSDAVLTAALSLATAGPLVAWAGTRRWLLLGIADSFFLLAVWAGWRWQELDLVYLPLAFASIAAVEWGALIRLRRYRWTTPEVDLVIAYLSWGPWLVASAVAGALLSGEQQDLAPGESIVDTSEWGLASAVLAMTSAAVFGEALRLRLRWIAVAGSAGLLTALIMAIATREPENIQWYTVPIGVYLTVLAMTFRASPQFIGENMHLHEAVMLAGVLFLVLPPAQQSFEPGGGKFGLELIGIGVVILLVGLVFHARWLVPAAILTLTGVSLRLVTGGLVSAPYWLLLGAAGTLLIVFGLLVLLERERWDKFRVDVVHWWTAAQSPGGRRWGGHAHV